MIPRILSIKHFDLKVVLLTLILVFCTAPNFQELAHSFVHQRDIVHSHTHHHDASTHSHHHGTQNPQNSHEPSQSHPHQFTSLLTASPVIITSPGAQAIISIHSVAILTVFEDLLDLNPPIPISLFQNRAPPLGPLFQQFLLANPTQAPPFA